jgi:hypothetical protein
MPDEMSRIIKRYESVLGAAVGKHSSGDRWELQRKPRRLIHLRWTACAT